jgi:hypothetical protein
MSLILGSVYLGNIDYYSILNQNSAIEIEVCEHFKKQSYRNRSVIHGANGALNLIIPLDKHGNRTKTQDVKIDNSQRWQKLHWRSIESAYRSSPFFEFYEDDLKPFYEIEYTSLVEFNAAIQNQVIELLGIEVELTPTRSYEKQEGLDYRILLSPKKEASSYFTPQSYIQVFSEKNGFLSNLSILDLLFNEGPNAINFLG